MLLQCLSWAVLIFKNNDEEVSLYNLINKKLKVELVRRSGAKAEVESRKSDAKS